MGVGRIDIHAMIKSVVKEVVNSMDLEKKAETRARLLFVFCDSSAHEPFSDLFIKLKNENIAYDKLFLDGDTSSWLGINQIESAGSSKVIAADANAPSPLELPKAYDGIVIPEIDLDNAARVVSGMKGSVKSEIIFSAILLNKFVLIGDNVSGIKRADRSTLNTLLLPPYYQKLFKKYKRQLGELGIQFADPKNLADTISEKFSKGEASQSTNDLVKSSRENKIPSGKKLVTPDWIASQSFNLNATICLPKDVIISPLAKDLIKEKCLTIRFIEQDEQ